MIQQFIEAGKIINTHGVTGEVKIEVWLDSPSFMKSFRRYYIEGKETNVLSARVQKNFLLVRLEGVNDLNAAIKLKGTVVSIAREDACLPKGHYFLCELLGMRVLEESGKEVGLLEEIEETPSAPLYTVRGEREVLIPAVPAFIKKVDLENNVITVSLIEGM